jgi:hypothetical protein
MKLTGAHNLFSETLLLASGRRFVGQVSRFNEQSSTLEWPSRMLKVSPRSAVVAGDIVVTKDGARHALAEHMDSISAGSVYRTFRMIRLDELIEWTRNTTTTHAVTGLKTSSGETALGDIWVTVDPINLEQVARQRPESKVRIVTASPLEVGDRLGAFYSVLFADRVLGITVAEAR